MQRKLTAILSADVVGYSGLMEHDEAGTLDRLKANRSAIFDPNVVSHGGRQFKLMGDGALVEFASVIAAVNCALAIQEATEKAEADLGDAKPMRYRIGINLGEVIVEGDDIYGEGVNVAARIQALAPVGGVALSKMVRDSVEGKMTCVFEDMGEHTVKNIERPVHVFLVRPNQVSAAPGHVREKKPRLSICVLPFANMSDDPQQEYFSDGISEDIITDLSKVSALSVIARNSSFAFKGKSVDVLLVARQLKVSHVLEGSVRKSGSRVRITAQLIDGATNDHVWAERYDRDLNDIFALQDEISEAIVTALKLKLLPEEKKAIEQRGTNNLEAYNLYLLARQYRVNGNMHVVRRHEAISRLCRSAIELDPSYALAWACLSNSLAILGMYPGRNFDAALEAAERAIALDPNLAEAHAAKARALQFGPLALEEIMIALKLDPDSYEANQTAGFFARANGQFEEAARYFEKAASLNEADYVSLGWLTESYIDGGDLKAARAAAQRTIARTQRIVVDEPDNGTAAAHNAMALAILGETERAKECIKRTLLFAPDSFFTRYLFASALVHMQDIESAIDLVEPAFEKGRISKNHQIFSRQILQPMRDHPRFKAIVAAAEARWAAEDAAAAKSPPS